ncbi:MAG: NAD(P)-dependent oxidoreductase [Ilumatobacteraceae bacterium]
MKRVGFIGLGSQGGPMARQIIDAGHPTTLWARRPETLEPYAGTTATLAGSPAEVGAASDVLCICVVDDAGVDEVLRGEAGALSTLADGSVVVIHSTVRPDTCIRLQADFPSLRILDAPVSGGGHKAAARELVVMVGGPEATLDDCRPILETFGNPVLHLGPLGAGEEAKLLNNTLFTAQLALAAEVFDVAAQRGLDQAAVAQILASGSGRSFAADIVGGSGFNLDAMAAGAGTLLAKDVGILVAHTGLSDSPLLTAADAALERMGVPRTLGEDHHV